MPLKIVIVDYGMSNIQSVFRKFSLLGITSIVSKDPSMIQAADKLILPGVGHFAKAMHNIKSQGLFDILNKKVLISNTPILGICLGMQLMTRHSEEGECDGFGWVNAEVKKFRVNDIVDYKVPHVGWNKIEIKKSSKLMRGIKNFSEFYFVHSYLCKCIDDADVLNISKYESPFVSAFERNNIYGVQYHPEKSFDAGKTLLYNFTQL